MRSFSSGGILARGMTVTTVNKAQSWRGTAIAERGLEMRGL
jgi:hypothetical protein